ncbi:hypothetical protein [Staphylococcus caledonicus]|uniref:hypothetical protein n=1 Tax=Staphylococcus caledonicus TaxID=2741333 RepID=UPI0018E4C1FC|nr:hypothetical protein [Staphylococcus caledonicus]MBI5972099.1 hypothetical protein [Staphylococcus caledonicus]
MTSTVDEFNRLIRTKKEQIDNFITEKKQVNNLLNEYQNIIKTTEHLNQHLTERYYKSRMFTHIEQNSELFHIVQRQAMNAIYYQQSDIDYNIQQLNEEIETIERKRNFEQQKGKEGGQ